MASGYPNSIDNFSTAFANSTAMTNTHAAIHNDVDDAIHKIELELGTNPSAAYADVAARFAALGTGSGTVLGWLNVLDYGADRTGASDSTSAFAAAVSALNTNGGTIYIPRGKYKIVGSSGVGVDISGKNVRFVGETVRSVNDSAPGFGSYIYTPTANLTLFSHTNGSQFQAGPVCENLTFGETVGGNTGVTLFKVDDCNHYYFRNVSFRGSDGNSSTVGLNLNGTIDASYGLVDFAFFRNCFTGYKVSSGPDISLDRVTNCYFLAGAGGSTQNSHVLADVQSGIHTFTGCKFESNDNTSGVGVKVNGGIVLMAQSEFEGVPTGVSFPGLGSFGNNGSQISHCGFVGSNGTETGVSVGANVGNVSIGPNFYSNLNTNVSDSGTNTVIWDRPDQGPANGTRRYVSFGGPGIYSDTGAPGSLSAPDGSLYLRTGGGSSAGLYVRVNGAWVAK